MSIKEQELKGARTPSLSSFKRAAAAALVLFLPLLFIHLACSNALALDEAPARTTSRPTQLWLFLPVGYLFTVAIEAPVLLLGLSKKFSFKERLFAGLWLTACTYPIVVLVLPTVFADSSRSLYLLVAETFAPVAECALFWLVFRDRLRSIRREPLRSFAVITLANLLSFGGGELLNSTRWFGLF